MKTVIYALCDGSGEIRYVGKTSLGLEKRINEHLSLARTVGKQYVHKWIRSLWAINRVPSVILLIECNGDGCDEERRQIALARVAGNRLTNLTDGGEGVTGLKQSERSKAASRAYGKKAMQDPVRLAKAVATLALYRFDENAKRKQAEKMRGRPKSPEAIAKTRAARLGKKLSPESIAKRTASRRGWSPSPEARAKQRQTLLATNQRKREARQRQKEIDQGGLFAQTT